MLGFSIEHQFERKIKMLQIDGGGEFRALLPHLQKCGITRTSCPHTHQQNWSIERKHRHIVEVGLSLLAYASMPQSFWAEAFQTASFLINRMPMSLLHNKSPFETLFKKVPDYKLLKVFGCLCWPCIRPYNRHKLNFHSVSCIFLGYNPSHKGYICQALDSSRTYISRDIIFDEVTFPFYKSLSFLSVSSSPSNTSHSTSMSLSCHPPRATSPSPLHFSHPFSTSPTLNSTPHLDSPTSIPDIPLNPKSSQPSDPPSPPLDDPPSCCTHVMHTHLQNHISKPKEFMDGSIRYPISRALMATIVSQEE